MGEVNAGEEKKRGNGGSGGGEAVADGRTCGPEGCIQFVNAITADVPSPNAKSDRLFCGLISFSLPFIHRAEYRRGQVSSAERAAIKSAATATPQPSAGTWTCHWANRDRITFISSHFNPHSCFSESPQVCNQTPPTEAPLVPFLTDAV